MFSVQTISKNNYFVKIKPKDTFPVSPSLGKDWKPSSCTLPPHFFHYVNQIHDFEVKSDDVWVITFPKCGTTWTQEMAWLIMNNLDYETAKSVKLEHRSPFLEWQAIGDEFKDDTLTETENLKSPRLIKSHLPVSFLPKQLWTVKPKIIYVARNPKDVALSFYHFSKILYPNAKNVTQDQFLDQFLNDSFVFSPYWTHILEFWKMRNDDHILFFTYEEMSKDLKSVIHKVCDFLGKKYTEEQIDQLAEHLSFKNMKNNPSCNLHKFVEESIKKFEVDTDFRFMRKGKVGSYKEEMSEEQNVKFDKWIEENLKDTDLKFGV